MREKRTRNTAITCRFCGGSTQYCFSLQVLGRYEVGYFECRGCNSLQTEKPYWLSEAYAIPGVHIDVGQAARIVQTWIRLSFLLDTIEFKKTADCIDYGGSAGLLTRLMRDTGFNFFAYDTYDTAKYANYFKVELLMDKRPSLISAFEVFEHFSDPRSALDEIFATGTDLVVFTTQFYEKQGPEWDYLVPECGQHVFFYGRRALSAAAERWGFELVRCLDFWIFVRNIGPYRDRIIALADAKFPSGYGGELLSRVGWAGEQTNHDHVYAKKRFNAELKQSGNKSYRWFKRLASRFRGQRVSTVVLKRD